MKNLNTGISKTGGNRGGTRGGQGVEQGPEIIVEGFLGTTEAR